MSHSSPLQIASRQQHDPALQIRVGCEEMPREFHSLRSVSVRKLRSVSNAPLFPIRAIQLAQKRRFTAHIRAAAELCIGLIVHERFGHVAVATFFAASSISGVNVVLRPLPETRVAASLSRMRLTSPDLVPRHLPLSSRHANLLQ